MSENLPNSSVLKNLCSHLTTSTVMIWNIPITAKSSLIDPASPLAPVTDLLPITVHLSFLKFHLSAVIECFVF